MYYWPFSNNNTESEKEVARDVLQQISLKLKNPLTPEDKKKRLIIVKKSIKYYFSL